jgi:hypothetical protein
MRKLIRWGVLVALITWGAILVFAQEDNTACAHNPEDPCEGTPTYYHDIQPILAANCLGCHTAGGIGPVSFEDPEVVSFGAMTIRESVISGEMPPWMPGDESPAMLEDRSLTDEQIQMISDWALAGAPLGDPAEAETLAPVPTSQLRTDLLLEMPEYTPDPTLLDDYRCFVLETGLDEDRFITGYTVEPGNAANVHHVLLFQVDNTLREAALALDAEDAPPGYSCFGGAQLTGGLAGGFSNGLAAVRSGAALISEGGSFLNTIGTWTPGQTDIIFPEGTGVRLDGDSFVVMQVHYYLGEDPGPDQTRVRLQFAPEDDTILPLSAITLLAPVEIPCPEDNISELCERDAALANAAEQDGARAYRRVNGLLGLCRQTLNDYARQDAASAASTCDYTLQEDALAVGAAAHMHELGTDFRITRNPDTDAQTLLHIPEWDFHWQGTYRYAEPILLRAGDVIRIECAWDNSQGDRYIVWGESTTDEMCLGGVTLRPVE